MPKQYLTTDQRARRVLNCCGRAPAVLASMSAENLERLAALCNTDGVMSPGGMEKARLVLIDHYAEHKATSDDTDPLPLPTNSESQT